MSKKKKVVQGSVDTTADLRKKLLEEVRLRVNKCNTELTALLEKYDCTLVAEILITESGNFPKIKVVDKGGR